MHGTSKSAVAALAVLALGAWLVPLGLGSDPAEPRIDDATISSGRAVDGDPQTSRVAASRDVDRDGRRERGHDEAVHHASGERSQHGDRDGDDRGRDDRPGGDRDGGDRGSDGRDGDDRGSDDDGSDDDRSGLTTVHARPDPVQHTGDDDDSSNSDDDSGESDDRRDDGGDDGGDDHGGDDGGDDDDDGGDD